jgi:hypothetical protein
MGRTSVITGSDGGVLRLVSAANIVGRCACPARRLRKDARMVVRRIARWSFSTTMLFAVSAAVAQTNHPAPGADGGEFRAACGEDLRRFCVGVQPGGGLVQCLWSHTGELSAACENLIAPSPESPATQTAAPVTVGNSPATTGSIFRASCGPDVQKLCAGARRESEILKCLESHRMELSTTCSSYFQKLAARPPAHENSPNKKPPSPPPTMARPAEKNPPDKESLSPLPTAPIPDQENAPNEEPSSPSPTTPIRD